MESNINKFYREIFLKSKKEIDKKLSLFKNKKEIKEYLQNTLLDTILRDEKKIREAFNKIKCANCGVCCRLAISEFPPEILLNKAKAGDIVSKSFIETFEIYENNKPPEDLLEKLPSSFRHDANTISNVYFYHCKKVEFKDGRYFCPIYEKRPDICKNYPDTPLENLPKTCAYNIWKDENETAAMFIKALNDIRKLYLDELLKEECQN